MRARRARVAWSSTLPPRTAAQGNLYVSHFDLAAAGGTGRVSVLSPAGKLLKEVEAPAPELTGIALDPEGTTVFVTESSTNTVFSMPAL